MRIRHVDFHLETKINHNENNNYFKKSKQNQKKKKNKKDASLLFLCNISILF